MHKLACLLLASAVVGTAASGCRSSKSAKDDAEMKGPVSYVEMAKERFGDNAEFIENATSEFVLVVSKSKVSPLSVNDAVKFFVFGKKENEVTYESEIVGSVTWLDDYHLEVVVLPRVVKADAESGGVTYRVDARTGSRVEETTPSRHR